MASTVAAVAGTVPEEDLLRAKFYRFLSRYLAAPADAELLADTAQLVGDATELGSALGALAAVAATTTPKDAAEEYTELFIGIGRGELVPYGSYYLTGFLNEKPLAKLRQDMARLGIARAAHAKEPEDHIGAVCEMMAGLIDGAFGAPAALAAQRAFFDRHLAPWGGRFFADLEAARSAKLYRPMGTVGRVFLEIEATAFEMET